MPQHYSNITLPIVHAAKYFFVSLCLDLDHVIWLSVIATLSSTCFPGECYLPGITVAIVSQYTVHNTN